MFGLTARLQAYYMGDFYPLTDETSAADDVWCGWSLHRPSENDGFALAFRRAGAPEETKTFELPAVDPTAKYEVEYFDGTKKVVSGEELAKLEVKLEPRSFFLAIYKKI
jgi:alpha-galactosidase